MSAVEHPFTTAAVPAPTMRSDPPEELYYPTVLGLVAAGPRAICIGDGERGCPVSVRADKPGGRCEFCARTVGERRA